MKKLSTRSAAGFTLLELMVVIVLAGILVSLVTINIAPDPRQQLQREAQRVGQLMALAADESRITQQPIVWKRISAVIDLSPSRAANVAC